MDVGETKNGDTGADAEGEDIVSPQEAQRDEGVERENVSANSSCFSSSFDIYTLTTQIKSNKTIRTQTCLLCLDDNVIDLPPWTNLFQPKPATSFLLSSPLTTAATTTTTMTTAKSEPFMIHKMSDFLPLSAQLQPNGTQHHHHAS